MAQKPLTEKEKRKIIALHIEGIPYHIIAKQIGRSAKAVETTVRLYKTDSSPAYKFIEYLRKPWPYYG